MTAIAIHFTEYALNLREANNIAITVFGVVLCLLCLWYVVEELSENGYKEAQWPVKFAIGFCFILTGEFIRSSTIWEILHNEGSAGTYLSDVGLLISSLLLITVGFLCCIRVMSYRWGYWIWVGSFVLFLLVCAYNWSDLIWEQFF